jgi:3D (Asp-Asp-Asp) domain-containing protein
MSLLLAPQFVIVFYLHVLGSFLINVCLFFFRSPFQAVVRHNRLMPDFRLKGNWVQKLTFSELTICLADLKEKPFSEVEQLKVHSSVIEALYVAVVVEGLERMWGTFADSGVSLTTRETDLYWEITSDPVKFIPQWIHINNLVSGRHTESHPVTVGVKHDLVKTKKKLKIMQSAAEVDWAASFKDVYEYCLIHCKYLMEKAEAETKKERESYIEEFNKCLIE